MLLRDNPMLDPRGPWVRTAEICVPNGSAEENRRAQRASRYVNDWLYTFCVLMPRVQWARQVVSNRPRVSINGGRVEPAECRCTGGRQGLGWCNCYRGRA